MLSSRYCMCRTIPPLPLPPPPHRADVLAPLLLWFVTSSAPPQLLLTILLVNKIILLLLPIPKLYLFCVAFRLVSSTFVVVPSPLSSSCLSLHRCCHHRPTAALRCFLLEKAGECNHMCCRQDNACTAPFHHYHFHHHHIVHMSWHHYCFVRQSCIRCSSRSIAEAILLELAVVRSHGLPLA